MLKKVLAGAAALTLLGSAVGYAQPWNRGDDGGRGHHWRMERGMERGMGPGMRLGRMNAEDASAFVDAKLASVRAGLKLNADQDKLWPPIEAAVRDFAKQRVLRANAMREQAGSDDPIARLRLRADTMAETAAGLKRIAETADPLYKTLDEAQKRRLSMLTRMGGRMGHQGGWGSWRMKWQDRDGDKPGGGEGRL